MAARPIARLACGLIVAAWVILAAIPVSAQRPGAESIEPVTTAELAEIRRAFLGVGLRQADLARASDGRITLIGEYENRDEVELAFATARAVVGLRRVAPTTPASIKYRLKGFEDAFSSTVGRMMRKAQPPPPKTELTPQPPKTEPVPDTMRAARTYGLVIGVGRYKHLPKDKWLEFADKDATDFYATLTSPAGGSLPREHIQLLRNEEANAAAVRGSMRKLMQEAQPGDTVVFFIASHGLPNAMGKFDVVLHDTQFRTKKAGANNEALDLAITDRTTTLRDDDLQEFIAQLVLKDVRTVVVLDTCYSGKTFAVVPGFLPSRTRSLTKYKKEVDYRAAPSPEAIEELAQKAKDAKTTRIVIVSASENEESLETPDIGGGMFTQLYVAALKNAHDYADAFDQSKPTVIKRARTVGMSQTPRLLVVPEEAVTKM